MFVPIRRRRSEEVYQSMFEWMPTRKEARLSGVGCYSAQAESGCSTPLVAGSPDRAVIKRLSGKIDDLRPEDVIQSRRVVSSSGGFAPQFRSVSRDCIARLKRPFVLAISTLHVCRLPGGPHRGRGPEGLVPSNIHERSRLNLMPAPNSARISRAGSDAHVPSADIVILCRS